MIRVTIEHIEFNGTPKLLTRLDINQDVFDAKELHGTIALKMDPPAQAMRATLMVKRALNKLFPER